MTLESRHQALSKDEILAMVIQVRAFVTCQSPVDAVK